MTAVLVNAQLSPQLVASVSEALSVDARARRKPRLRDAEDRVIRNQARAAVSAFAVQKSDLLCQDSDVVFYFRRLKPTVTPIEKTGSLESKPTGTLTDGSSVKFVPNSRLTPPLIRPPVSFTLSELPFNEADAR